MLPDLEPPFISPSMCRTRRDTLVSNPKPKHHHRQSTPRPSSNAPPSSPPPPALRYSTTNSATFPADLSSLHFSTSSSSSSSSVAASLSGLRLSLNDGSPTLYPFHEIAAATNNFLSKRLASSSWRCTLRSRDAVILQLAFRADPVSLPSRLSSLCKCNHSSLVKLLGASLTADYIYLVYDYTPGATLKECLRNPRNPNFTPLSKWISRMQVAADLAQGLEYIHFHCRTIHNRIKSSTVIVTEPTFNAKISLFGVADLAGEVPEEEKKKIEEEDDEEEAEEEEEEEEGINLKRSDSRKMRIDGTRGYIAPEVIAGGRISQKSDVFAFGVVMLELLSGREPLEYTVNEEKSEYGKVSLIETARDAIGTEDDDGASEEEAEERRWRVRRWVDRRLRDSFPVDAAEKLVRLALRCVEAEAFMRPQMTEVAGRVSKLFLDSTVWEENVRHPADFSVTIGPR